MAKKYIIYGRVQGVGFRYFVYQLANKLNINGSVKNLLDGSVEVILEGKEHYHILEEIKKGNFFSRVDRIEYVGEIDKIYENFEITY
jgi:acylphosphatase